MQKKLLRLVSIFLIPSFLISGCVSYRPKPFQESALTEHIDTQTQGEVTVSVAALGDKEAERYFGVPLYHKGIQPLWIAIENRGKQPLLFNEHSVDPNYYAPEEAAYIAHHSYGKWLIALGVMSIFFFPIAGAIPIEFACVKVANDKMNKTFVRLGISNDMIMPGEKTAGFVFVPLHEGKRVVNLSLFSEEGDKNFEFFVTTPGLTFDYDKRDFDALYPPDKQVALSEEELKSVLEKMPAQTEDKKGNTKGGDPLNVAFVGELDDIIYAFTAAHWDQAESLSFHSGKRMAAAFLFGRSDPTSPFSSLYYDGRSQDLGFQKPRATVNERLHLRLWMTQYRYQKKPVWIGTVSRDIGVKFTLKTWNMMTHQIDPNIDDARDYVVADLAEAGRVSYFGFLSGIPPASKEKPRKNRMGEPYYTDGLKVVIQVSEDDAKAKYFPWAFPLFSVKDA